MKERVIGIENEYGVIDASPESHGDASDQLLDHVLEKGGFPFGLLLSGRLWLKNGGCMYRDMQKLEWASPECRRVRDVVLYNKVGERLLSRMVCVGGSEPLINLFKTNIATHKGLTVEERTHEEWSIGQLVSFGCHENYLTHNIVPAHVSAGPYFVLIPFLITRQLYGGSGWWQNGREELFQRSQRASFIHHETNGATTLEYRSIINTRNESHTGSLTNLHRMHYIAGDANMLEYALFLKIGATKLMLDLLEEGLLPNWRVRPSEGPFGFPSSVSAFRAISCERDPARQMVMIAEGNGDAVWHPMSPLEIQTAYCELAHKYVQTTRFETEESEAEAKRICMMWDETLAALARNDASFLTGRIDWYTKRRIVETMLARAKSPGELVHADKVRMDMDTLYHEVCRGSLYEQLTQRGVAVRVVTDEEIARAMSEPPPPTLERGTRASVRGEGIRRLMEYCGLLESGQKIPVKPSFTWDVIRFCKETKEKDHIETKYYSIPMDNPLTYTSPELDTSLDNLSKGEPLPESLVGTYHPMLYSG